MDPNETSGNETSSGMVLVCNKPGKCLSSMPSHCYVPGPDQLPDYNCNYGLCSCGAFPTSFLGDTEMLEELFPDALSSLFPELEEQNGSFSDGDWPDSIIPSLVNAVADNGSSPVSLSPFTCRLVSSTPEQGEDAEAHPYNMASKVASRQPTRNPEPGRFSVDAATHGKSVIGNNDSCTDTSVDVLPAEASIHSMCPCCVMPASACHGHHFPSSEVEWKGVKKKKNSNKWSSEIRVSTKILQDSKVKKRGKLWLGTFDTAEEARRAFHVGQYLLSAVKSKQAQRGTVTFDPNTERVLSDFKTCLYAKPVTDKLFQIVKKLAKDYGKNRSL